MCLLSVFPCSPVQSGYKYAMWILNKFDKVELVTTTRRHPVYLGMNYRDEPSDIAIMTNYPSPMQHDKSYEFGLHFWAGEPDPKVNRVVVLHVETTDAYAADERIVTARDSGVSTEIMCRSAKYTFINTDAAAIVLLHCLLHIHPEENSSEKTRILNNAILHIEKHLPRKEE